MASEREPGWYWVRVQHTNKHWSHWEPRSLQEAQSIEADGWPVEWGPRIHPPDAEHPNVALRERLGALADAWERERGPADNTGVLNQLVGRCAAELRALLRTEGQPPAKEDE